MPFLMRAATRGLALLSPLFALCALSGAARADDFLDPDQAFQVSAKALDDHRVEIDYTITPGYYLYRERFHFEAPAAVKLGDPVFPKGKVHYDPNFEKDVETYTQAVAVVVPVTSGPAAFDLTATHQGCAEKGLCYPPQVRTVHVELKGLGAAANVVTVAKPADDAPAASSSTSSSGEAVTGTSSVRSAVLGGAASAPEASLAASAPASAPAADAGDLNDRLHTALAGGHLGWAILLCVALGLLLAATPCVWPMFPILASIIFGQGKAVSRVRGFGLASMYSLGVVLVYTGLGVIAGLAGKGFQGALQQPPVLIAFGVLLVVLSLSMFGLYEIQIPAFIRDRLTERSQKLQGGQMGGVFFMGVLSALVVSPCVSAPLITVLGYIAKTQDAFLGGTALFSLAVGMCLPLLVIGATAGSLPRSGAWMDRVKQACGWVLIGVALYTVQPLLPAWATMVAWGTLAIVATASLGAFEPTSGGAVARAFRGLGLLVALLGALELVGVATGGRDPLQPLAKLTSGGTAVDAGPRFDRVLSVADLDHRLQVAGKPVMLDFYADWCTSCKEMEKSTFPDPAVRAKLDQMVLLRADVTANSADDRALLQRFHLFGAPGIIFFDAQGHELPRRVDGFEDPEAFVKSLAANGL
jgi:thiol:disulfide interchange protein DsbD